MQLAFNQNKANLHTDSKGALVPAPQTMAALARSQADKLRDVSGMARRGEQQAGG